MAILTKVSFAKKGTKSLRTTIPEVVVEVLNLADKDGLEWTIVVQGGNQLVVLVRKSGDSESKAEGKKKRRS